MPPTWTYECDEDLVHFLYDHIGKEDENLASELICNLNPATDSQMRYKSGSSSEMYLVLWLMDTNLQSLMSLKFWSLN